MRLYRLRIRGRAHYAGTQADARGLKRDTGAAWEEVDVPTGKAELIAFLNENAPGTPATPASPPAPAAPPVEQLRPAPAPLPLDAASVLARMDNPALDLDAIIETIARMKGGYALKRVAGAVAVRFEELSR